MCVFVADRTRCSHYNLELQEHFDMIRRGHLTYQLSQLFKITHLQDNENDLSFWNRFVGHGFNLEMLILGIVFDGLITFTDTQANFRDGIRYVPISRSFPWMQLKLECSFDLGLLVLLQIWLIG